MRRRYQTADYARLIHRIRETLPHSGIGADVIVGFPGETESQFDQTYAFLQDLPVTYLHVFTYSERPNTPAAVLSGSVSPRERSRRNTMLRTLGEKKRQVFLESLKGKSLKVLLESDVDEGNRYGFTDSYARVGVPEEGTEENTIVDARIREVRGGFCLGEMEET
jgi:threonylcarbamoyladenosine tRNA methylthiotransferase MtaB